MEVSASVVKELRERTGAGFMECKKALAESAGDLDKAIDFLRKAGLAKAGKKAGREASEGLVSSYIHPGGRVGVLLEVNCETDFVARTDDFQALVKDIAMQVAAASPLAVRREDLPADRVASEREIFRAQVEALKKPPAVVEKIVEGKLEKYYSEVCLLEQPFIKDPDRKVSDLVNEKIAKLGENIVVRRFSRFALGESI